MKNSAMIVCAAFLSAAVVWSAEAAPRELFNGKDLSGWYTFLKGRGKNSDPKGVFSVKDGVIRITGEEWGSLITDEEFADYRLTVEYRFTGKKFPSKEKAALDSGILFHSVGEDGGFAKIWMASHEYNLIQGASGDVWGVHPKNSGMSFTGEVAEERQGGKHFIWKEGGRREVFSGNLRLARGDIAPEWTDTPEAPLAWNEKPVGQWNTAVLECRGDVASCYFNGRLVNRVFDLKPARGRIQLQSEGCGIEFRRVTIESLLGDRPWVSLEEKLNTRRRHYAIDSQPGTPEGDAVRFYRDPYKKDWAQANYDESKAGVLGKDYTIEDPFTFADGRKVKNKADWQARRAEILKIFEEEVYGVMPPKPDAMLFDLVSEKLTEDRFAVERRYRQYFRADKTGPVIDWIVFVPKYAKKPCPVILHLNYKGNDNIARGFTNHYLLPVGDMIAHGYAFMSAQYTQITADPRDMAGFTHVYDGVYELWGYRDPKRTNLTGTLMAWAWGLSRGLDLATDIPEIDATRNVVVGSSRLGKAAFLAAAYDERFTACVPNQTGAIGVQLMKRDYGENLKTQELAFPHWYCSAVWKYRDDTRKMPFDMHLLAACIAPRALLLECYHKKWFDPVGEWLAAKAASPVWEFLTGKGLGADEWPEPYSEALVKPPFGYVRRTECHGLSPYDWKWALDFADQVFGK
ncbi:MAG: DUF1080 domain-containing protein [Kiritimatiellae bacterium]|nr:DUF1080 domain-containing protein [Kiritimatiellia bacterium]